MYRIGIAAVLCCFIFAAQEIVASPLSTQPEDTVYGYRITLLPDSHLVPLFTADQRAHRLSLLNIGATSEFIGSMGGIFPVVRVRKKEMAFQLSMAASLYTTLVRHTGGGQLLNTDIFADIWLDFKLNQHIALRTGAGHTSQHLADDLAPKLLSINYVRDYYTLIGSYKVPRAHLHVYGGIIFNSNFKTTNDSEAFDLSNTPMFQIGFEHAPFRVGPYGRIYWAADLKVRGEVDYGTTQNVQAGVRFTNASARTIRFAVNYGWGYDERGQFYTHQRDYVYMGFYLDF